MSRVAVTQKASDFQLTSTDEPQNGRSPGDWIAGIVRQKDRWERFEVRGGATPSPRKMEQVAIIDIDGDSDEIFARVQSCALACGYRYVRVAAYAKGAKRPSDMLAWPIPDADDLADDDADNLTVTDPRNAYSACAGLLRQSYAFNQVLMNQVASLTTSHLLHLQAENKALREERGEMRAQVIQSEQALSDREMRAFQMQQTQLRDRVIAEGATSLVQAAATHLAALPPGQSPLTKAIERLTASLTNEQMATLMHTLTGEQQALFVSVLESVQKAKANDKGGEDGAAQ